MQTLKANAILLRLKKMTMESYKINVMCIICRHNLAYMHGKTILVMSIL